MTAGDSIYPHEPWLTTPLCTATICQDMAYNNAHCKIYNIAERCHGVLQLPLCKPVWWHTVVLGREGMQAADGCSSVAQLLYQPAAISTLSSTQQWWHAARQFSPPAQPATLSHSFTCDGLLCSSSNNTALWCTTCCKLYVQMHCSVTTHCCCVVVLKTMFKYVIPNCLL